MSSFNTANGSVASLGRLSLIDGVIHRVADNGTILGELDSNLYFDFSHHSMKMEISLPDSFYLVPDVYPARFSTKLQTRAKRSAPYPRSPVVARSDLAMAIHQKATSLRLEFPDLALSIDNTTLHWTTLYEYFDAEDLAIEGPQFLFYVIHYIGNGNRQLAQAIEREQDAGIHSWAQEWIDCNQVRLLNTPFNQPVRSIFNQEDIESTTGLKPREEMVLDFALECYRREFLENRQQNAPVASSQPLTSMFVAQNMQGQTLSYQNLMDIGPKLPTALNVRNYHANNNNQPWDRRSRGYSNENSIYPNGAGPVDNTTFNNGGYRRPNNQRRLSKTVDPQPVYFHNSQYRSPSFEGDRASKANNRGGQRPYTHSKIDQIRISNDARVLQQLENRETQRARMAKSYIDTERTWEATINQDTTKPQVMNRNRDNFMVQNSAAALWMDVFANNPRARVIPDEPRPRCTFWYMGEPRALRHEDDSKYTLYIGGASVEDFTSHRVHQLAYEYGKVEFITQILSYYGGLSTFVKFEKEIDHEYAIRHLNEYMMPAGNRLIVNRPKSRSRSGSESSQRGYNSQYRFGAHNSGARKFYTHTRDTSYGNQSVSYGSMTPSPPQNHRPTNSLANMPQSQLPSMNETLESAASEMVQHKSAMNRHNQRPDNNIPNTNKGSKQHHPNQKENLAPNNVVASLPSPKKKRQGGKIRKCSKQNSSARPTPAESPVKATMSTVSPLDAKLVNELINEQRLANKKYEPDVQNCTSEKTNAAAVPLPKQVDLRAPEVSLLQNPSIAVAVVALDNEQSKDCYKKFGTFSNEDEKKDNESSYLNIKSSKSDSEHLTTLGVGPLDSDSSNPILLDNQSVSKDEMNGLQLSRQTQEGPILKVKSEVVLNVVHGEAKSGELRQTLGNTTSQKKRKLKGKKKRSMPNLNSSSQTDHPSDCSSSSSQRSSSFDSITLATSDTASSSRTLSKSSQASRTSLEEVEKVAFQNLANTSNTSISEGGVQTPALYQSNPEIGSPAESKESTPKAVAIRKAKTNHIKNGSNTSSSSNGSMRKVDLANFLKQDEKDQNRAQDNPKSSSSSSSQSPPSPSSPSSAIVSDNPAQWPALGPAKDSASSIADGKPPTILRTIAIINPVIPLNMQQRPRQPIDSENWPFVKKCIPK